MANSRVVWPTILWCVPVGTHRASSLLGEVVMEKKEEEEEVVMGKLQSLQGRWR